MNRLNVFATCPQSVNYTAGTYSEAVSKVATWSEEAGCEGILVYSDHRLTDPWLTSAKIMEATQSLIPLIAVQPVYMHPYTVAKMVASFYLLNNRRVALNMIAGGFRNDLHSLGDHTPHDERYDRLYEYTHIIQQLLLQSQQLNQEGKYYSVSQLALSSEFHADFMPEVFVSGSSPAGRETAEQLGATVVEYPEPMNADTPPSISNGHADREIKGIRLGIIARKTSEQAWEVAKARFPGTRAGELLHTLAMRSSDSQWHRHLSSLDEYPSDSRIYWLGPFKNYSTFCPYLVGSYREVAEYLQQYLAQGYSRLILDIPPDRDDINYSMETINMATEGVKV